MGRVVGIDLGTTNSCVAILERGDFFGEVSILLSEPPTADVVATS